jgi:hypothetical protein
MLRQVLAVGFAFIALGLLVSKVWAQSTSPTVPVSFTITSPSGAKVARACVSIRGYGRDFRLQMAADDFGLVTVVLPLGSYEVFAMSQGFEKAIKDLDVQKNSAQSIELRLAIGAGGPLEVTAAPFPTPICTGCSCYAADKK